MRVEVGVGSNRVAVRLEVVRSHRVVVQLRRLRTALERVLAVMHDAVEDVGLARTGRRAGRFLVVRHDRVALAAPPSEAPRVHQPRGVDEDGKERERHDRLPQVNHIRADERVDEPQPQVSPHGPGGRPPKHPAVLDRLEHAIGQCDRAHREDDKQVVRAAADDGGRADLAGRLIQGQHRLDNRQQDLRRAGPDRQKRDVGNRPVPHRDLADDGVAHLVDALHLFLRHRDDLGTRRKCIGGGSVGGRGRRGEGREQWASAAYPQVRIGRRWVTATLLG
eukprot:157998-Chlamydomonas_euryale.AAC.2